MMIGSMYAVQCADMKLKLYKKTHKKGGKPSFLSKLYASSVYKENNCDLCGYVAKNVRALTAHHRGCAQKNNVILNVLNGQPMETLIMRCNIILIVFKKNRASHIDCFYALHNGVLLRITHEKIYKILRCVISKIIYFKFS